MCVCEQVCVADLQLHRPRCALEQSDGLRVGHAVSGGSADADDAISNLEEREFTRLYSPNAAGGYLTPPHPASCCTERQLWLSGGGQRRR